MFDISRALMACAHSGDGRGLSKEIECGRCSQSSAAAAAVSRRYPYAHGRRRTRVRWDRRLHNGVGINHPSLIGASLHSRRFILLCYLAVVSLLIAGFIAPADAYSSSSSSASSSPKPNNKSGGGIPIEGTFKGTWVLQDDDVDNNNGTDGAQRADRDQHNSTKATGHDVQEAQVKGVEFALLSRHVLQDRSGQNLYELCIDSIAEVESVTRL